MTKQKNNFSFEELITAEQLGKIFNTSARSVVRMRNKEGLPFYRIPGIGVRFDLNEVNTWVKQYRLRAHPLSTSFVKGGSDD